MTPRTSRSYWLTLCLVAAPIIVLLVHMTRGALGEPYIGYNDFYGHDRFDDAVELLVAWAVSGVLIVIYAGGLALTASELRERG